MIIVRCQNCRVKVQVPSPGVYRCHNCREVIEVTPDSIAVKDNKSIPEAKTINLNDQSIDRENFSSEPEKEFPSAFCRRHRGKKATKTCNNCGDLMCDDCSIRLDDKYYCPECIRKIQNVAQQSRTIGDNAPAPGQSSIPFENASSGNFPLSFLATIKKIYLNYAQFFNKTGKDTFLGRATIYAIVILVFHEIARFAAINYLGLVPEKATGDMPPIMKEIYESYSMPTIKSLLISPLTALFGLVILSAIYHLGVLLIKGGGSFKTTMKIVCYSNSAQLISIIFLPAPLIGAMLSFVASIIFVTQGCIKLHNFTEGKSIFIALFPTILLIVFIIAGLFTFIK